MNLKHWLSKNSFLLLILLFAIFLRFFKLDLQSLWVDELFSANLSSPKLSFTEVLSNFKKTAHPPLYFIILYFFTKVFGATSLALKSLSAILGVLGVYGIYKLGKELLNKNIGLLAAALLSFNYFHIYYSQEARMYAFFFLLATWSFYLLVKFIKSPNKKSAILYGISAAMLINTHYFGLLTLAAQIVIMSYFLWKPYLISRGKYLLLSGISGLLVIISYLPVFKTVEGHSSVKSIWIPKPHYDSLKEVFKAFFGHSEVVVILIILLVFLFIIKLTKIKNTKSFKIDPVKNKWVFTSFILITWIIVGVFIPVYRSNAKVPIIIDRYFIHLITPLLLICSIGLYSIKNQILRYGFLFTIVLFSILNLFFERWHYKGVYKSQLREVCAYIEKGNDVQVISSLGRHLIYYLPEKKIIERRLSNHIKELQKDSTLIQDFWYADGHTRKYSTTVVEEKFLKTKFVLQDSISLFDAWAKHYVLKQKK